jgi:release factor glutamine methyltransferase
MTLAEWIQQGRSRLASHPLQCADPLLHMKQITAAALGWDMATLYLKWNDEVTPEQTQRVTSLLTRRLTGEPFQYIVGEESFWNSSFKVGPGVLIPRRETEHLIEAALKHVHQPEARIAELGAGTGNIGISLLQERPQWEWHAFEIHAEALPYVRANRAQLLSERANYTLHEQDFFEGVTSLGPLDAIICNPPYVKAGDIPALSLEVRHEPLRALDGGVEGLDILRRLVDVAESTLVEGGYLIVEIGSDQGESSPKLLSPDQWRDIAVLPDYSGLPRLLRARLKGDR